MSEKYEKYKKAVNKPQRVMKRAFDAVKDWSPQNKWMQLVRVPTATVAFNLYLAMLLFTRIGLENPIIEKLDNVNVKKTVNKSAKTKFGRFVAKIRKREKTNPTLSAILVYYMMLTMLVGGVKIATNNRDVIDEEDEEPKQEQPKEVRREIDAIKINPSGTQEDWIKQMDAIWPYLYMETILSEGFINEAYADVGDTKGYLTIGSGYMIGKANPRGKKDRAIIKERKAFFKKVLGKPFVNGVQITYEENQILMRAFYETYVWPYMKKAFTEPMDAHLFIELCIANFNRGSGIYNDGNDGAEIKKAVNQGDSLVQIVNKFDDLCKSGFDGLLPKYGVAAHRVLGDISDENVLNSLANSVYTISKRNVWENGVLKQYSDIAQDLIDVNNTDVKKNGKTYIQHQVRDYLTPWEVETITNGKLFIASITDFQGVSEQEETTAQKLNEQGEALYVSEDYMAAIDKFNLALKQDPDMYIVYSNLVLSYYKLGEYERAINIVNGLMNSQRFKLMPASVKGYTYYNVALCYEKLGDRAKDAKQQLEYYQLAKTNAETGQNVAHTRYVDFVKRINSKISTVGKSKAVAFNQGIENLKHNYQTSSFVYSNDNEFQA